MSYVLEAIIGRGELLSGTFGGRAVVLLVQGLGMVPMTNTFLRNWDDGSTKVPLGFTFLPASLVNVLAASSHKGPLAYVEAEYFGGVGLQRAVV